MLAFMLSCAEIVAQEVSFSALGAGGVFVKKDERMAKLVSNTSVRYYGLSAMWTAKGDSVSLDDDIWGRPTIEGGVMIGDLTDVRLHREGCPHLDNVTYKSGLGCVITPYAAFRRPLIRTADVTAGYRFENGIGIATRPYNRYTNIENEIIGNTVSVFVGMGFYATLRLSQHVSLGLDATFRHYSNGKLNMPNVGSNTLDAGLRAIYTLERDTVVHSPYRHGFNKGFKKHVYADVNVGWCPQTLLPEWSYDYDLVPEARHASYKLHDGWSASAAVMWRYSRKYACGFGADYTYLPFMDDVEKAETMLGNKADYDLSRHVFGLSLRHEAFYKNISLHASLGYYLFKRLGVVADNNQKSYYETIGIRWYTPFTKKKMYLGYNINASAVVANHFQFIVGVNLR